MPFFIPVAIGAAVAGVAAAGAIGTVVKKRRDKKKRQREDAHPEPPVRQGVQGERSSARPAQRPQRANPVPKPVRQEQHPRTQLDDRPIQRLGQQQPQTTEHRESSQRQNEYHLVAEHLPEDMVRT